MTGDRIVDVPTAARRDPQRATVRLLPLHLFPGLPLPGEPVQLRMAGTFQPVPGHIHFIHWGDRVVAVEPDLQLIRQTDPPHHGRRDYPNPSRVTSLSSPRQASSPRPA